LQSGYSIKIDKAYFKIAEIFVEPSLFVFAAISFLTMVSCSIESRVDDSGRGCWGVCSDGSSWRVEKKK
jgi:hypothetical protein